MRGCSSAAFAIGLCWLAVVLRLLFVAGPSPQGAEAWSVVEITEDESI
jgi:hypothetical protein